MFLKSTQLMPHYRQYHALDCNVLLAYLPDLAHLSVLLINSLYYQYTTIY